MSDSAALTPFSTSGSSILSQTSSSNTTKKSVSFNLANDDLNPTGLPQQSTITSSSSSSPANFSSSTASTTTTTTETATTAAAATVETATTQPPATKEEALQQIKNHAEAQVANIINPSTNQDAKYTEPKLQTLHLERFNLESRMTPEQFEGPKPKAPENPASEKPPDKSGDGASQEKTKFPREFTGLKQFYNHAIGVRANPQQYDDKSSIKLRVSQTETRTYAPIGVDSSLTHVTRAYEDGLKATDNEIHQIEKEAADNALTKTIKTGGIGHELFEANKGKSKKEVLEAINESPHADKLREVAKLSVLNADERKLLNNSYADEGFKKELNDKVDGRLLRLFEAKESSMEAVRRIGGGVCKKLCQAVFGILGAVFVVPFLVIDALGSLRNAVVIGIYGLVTKDWGTKDEFYAHVIDPKTTIQLYRDVKDLLKGAFVEPIKPKFS